MSDVFARTIPDTQRVSGLGRTTIYKAIGAGKLVAVKAGNRTLVTDESLRSFLASLPKADIRTGQAKKAA
jgi:hypothetical protein